MRGRVPKVWAIQAGLAYAARRPPSFPFFASFRALRELPIRAI